MSVARSDGETGDFLLQHQRGGGLDGCRRLHGDGVARHDVMGAFVEGSSITIRFRQGADVRADRFQKVAVGNDADEFAPFDNQQVMEMMLLKKAPDRCKRVVHCDGDDMSGHDGTGGQFGRGRLHGRLHGLSCLIIGGTE